jgi:hypothetical protein
VDDLVQWLRIQLDDEAEAARAAMDRESDWWWGDDAGTPAERHIARHDPARVLREIEAKRDLLRFAEGIHDHHETFTTGVASRLEDTLRLFAAAYADRPGYQETWRP